MNNKGCNLDVNDLRCVLEKVTRLKHMDFRENVLDFVFPGVSAGDERE